MSIAQSFDEALRAETSLDARAPDLLPVHLTRAAAKVLGVDGAGLSVHGDAQWRVPLGASDETAAAAERLQFTAGSGPCLLAARSGWPVFGVEPILSRRWPVFHELLVTRTPYRSLIALPLRAELAGLGCLSLYFGHSDAVCTVDAFDARAVAEMASLRMGDAAAWPTGASSDDPPWRNGPPARRRAAVWQAMGMVSLALEVTAPDALAMLRGHAFASGRDVDEIAAEVVSGRLSMAALERAESDR